MNKCEFEATNRIVEVFTNHNLNFNVTNFNYIEMVKVRFSIDSGPTVTMQFVSTDNENDVSVRIFGVVTDIPADKRLRLMEACNVCNCNYRFLKFWIDDGDNLDVGYDFPKNTAADEVGVIAYEIFVFALTIFDELYDFFMKALYTNEPIKL